MSTISRSAIHLQQELATGLLDDHARISPKFFYDALGSVLFEAICQLPEYYLTRTEAGIFDQNLAALSHVIEPGGTLIDLGAGNCAKAAKLFSHLHPEQYVPIDISADHLIDAVQRLQQRFPHIEMTALGMDFSADWTLPDQVRGDRRLFFYPGSSIGNFQPDAAWAFLKKIRSVCDDEGGILIGVDLIKPHDVMHAAYNDELGVTAAFNLNILRHVNQTLGTNFNVRQWQHRAHFNPEKSRIEMHLEARENHVITWNDQHRRFITGERIHTENSYKYTLSHILALLESAGFGHAQHWTDTQNFFAVIYAKAN